MGTKKDFTQVAHAVFQQATGEAPKPKSKRDTAVAAGSKGGNARSAKLPASERKRIATKAAKARWKK